MSGLKRCQVVYAGARWHYRWDLELPLDATVKGALAAAKARPPCSSAAPQAALGAATSEEPEDVPWESPDVGIFGEPALLSDVPRDGDRIEIHRPLLHDPKDARRQRSRQRARR